MDRSTCYYVLRDEETNEIYNIAKIDSTGSYVYKNSKWARNNGLIKIENGMTMYDKVDEKDIDKVIEEFEKQKGLVYVITNPGMPDLVKIGVTNRTIQQRLSDLDRTETAYPFEPYFSVRTSKYKQLEKVAHRELDKFTDTRARPNREFFKIDPESAKDLLLNLSRLLDDAEIENYGNDSAEDVVNADGTIKPVSKNTTFGMLNIPIGTALEPISDTFPPVTTVDDKNLVRLENGEVKTISRVAVDAYGDRKNGFAAYKYNGKSLDKIRKEMDKNYLPSHKR